MKDNLNILKAEAEDLMSILDLQKTAYLSEARLVGDYSIPPLTQTIEEIIGEYKNGIILKAVIISLPAKIIGSIRAYCDNDTVFIGKLMVHPDYQNQGIGKTLLSAVEAYYPNKRYELFTSSLSAKNLSLYTKHGYTEFKREQHGSIKFIYLEKL